MMPTADWLGRLYQSANRLAHLSFLRSHIQIPAWLVNVYFTNDPDPIRSTSREQWDVALKAIKEELAVSGLQLPYMCDLFLPPRPRKELKRAYQVDGGERHEDHRRVPEVATAVSVHGL